MGTLTHLTPTGSASAGPGAAGGVSVPTMVDVGGKPATARSAVAEATLTLPPAVAATLPTTPGEQVRRGGLWRVRWRRASRS
jgi:hypothetical protein